MARPDISRFFCRLDSRSWERSVESLTLNFQRLISLRIRQRFGALTERYLIPAPCPPAPLPPPHPAGMAVASQSRASPLLATYQLRTMTVITVNIPRGTNLGTRKIYRFRGGNLFINLFSTRLPRDYCSAGYLKVGRFKPLGGSRLMEGIDDAPRLKSSILVLGVRKRAFEVGNNRSFALVAESRLASLRFWSRQWGIFFCWSMVEKYQDAFLRLA